VAEHFFYGSYGVVKSVPFQQTKGFIGIVPKSNYRRVIGIVSMVA
jgi:hypothetical protein